MKYKNEEKLIHKNNTLFVEINVNEIQLSSDTFNTAEHSKLSLLMFMY